MTTLGIVFHMQIKAAIAKISIFANISGTIKDN
jgi:hypothetical protein